MQKTTNLKSTKTDFLNSATQSGEYNRNHVRSIEMKGAKKIPFDPVGQGLKIVSPSWPLQNAVAVNPFWFNKDKHVTEVFADLASFVGQKIFMPLSYYKDRYRRGAIDKSDLEEALQRVRHHSPRISFDIQDIISMPETDSVTKKFKTASEGIKVSGLPPGYVHQQINDDLAKYCAAYFDDNQALVKYPWQSGSFWLGWFEAQKYDKAMEKLGIHTFRQVIQEMREKPIQQCFSEAFEYLGFSDSITQQFYVQSLLVTTLGWASQFKYVEWQDELGNPTNKKTETRELVAVRMLYDIAFYRYCEKLCPAEAAHWRESFIKSCSDDNNKEKNLTECVYHYVWLLAHEISLQKNLARDLNTIKFLDASKSILPRVQMAFCIDVRSEYLRRGVEKMDSGIQTIGFAGFFGLPLAVRKKGEKLFGNRLPVLLKPSIEVSECDACDHDLDIRNDSIMHRSFIVSYFRNLRKASLGSFLFVEIFGILTLGQFAYRHFKALYEKLRGMPYPSRFGKNAVKSRGKKEKPDDHQGVTKEKISEQVACAEKILTHMGLTENFARLIVLCGHGAQTTNNALASALDCGACGGHAGDENARQAALLLNEKMVRKDLGLRGIKIPEDTVFVAAVHETVTDQVLILDQELIPNSHAQEIEELKRTLHNASQFASKEKAESRSTVPTNNPTRRAFDWSETRPEWGLAGNAHFIVAPRSRTKNLNLQGRAFLHDYYWDRDKDFKTLELIMTAPMVVTNWINMQYYGSVVVPDVFGSGNKVLHNITGENGVVEGNGGDLRIGLSHQSVHDGEKYVHEPVRLSVFIEAPKHAIEEIIEQHRVVHDLVTNEWLHLLQIEPESKAVFRRSKVGEYLPVSLG